MRLGFVSGAKPILDIIDLNTSNTNLQPSSTTQAMVVVLLNKWGYEGFVAHTERVAAFYKEKRDMFERVAHKYLDGLASWVSPEAGMFVRLLFPSFSFSLSFSSLLAPLPSHPHLLRPLSSVLTLPSLSQLYLDLHLTTDGTPGDSSALISTVARDKGVLAVPGSSFNPNGGISSSVRVSFSLATEEDAELAFQRLRECVLEARGEK
jgi:tryptophan aminotransferase